MNLYIEERWTVVSTGIKKLLVETVAYVFTDIQFLDSHNLYLSKKWLKVAQE